MYLKWNINLLIEIPVEKPNQEERYVSEDILYFWDTIKNKKKLMKLLMPMDGYIVVILEPLCLRLML